VTPKEWGFYFTLRDLFTTFVSLIKKQKIMKLKTFLFALLSILTLNVFSQFPVNVYVVGGSPNCPVTVMGYYASPDSTLTGTLTFTYSPNGLWISSVPTPTADVVVSVCAIDCQGASQCTGGPITPGTVTTFDIVLNTLL
jgi:hypothetical protein